jgi:hypothetical protein
VKKDEAEGGEEPHPLDDQSEISYEETEGRVEGIIKTNRISLLMELDEYVDQAYVSSIRELLSPASFIPFIDLLFSVEHFFLYPPLFCSSFQLYSLVRLNHPWLQSPSNRRCRGLPSASVDF